MKFQKILRGVSNGQMSDDALIKLVQDLSRETIASSVGGISHAALIVSRGDQNDGFFEIEFSELALALLETTQDKRAELVKTLFENITATVH